MTFISVSCHKILLTCSIAEEERSALLRISSELMSEEFNDTSK